MNEDGLLDLIRDSKSKPEAVKKPVKKSPKKSPKKTPEVSTYQNQESQKYTLESIRRDKVDVSSLSVKAIKEILEINNVSTAGLVEKSELVSKVNSLMGNGVGTGERPGHISIEMIKEENIDLNSIPIVALKEILENNGISTSGLLEKSELQNAVKNLVLKYVPKKHKTSDLPTEYAAKKPKIEHEVARIAIDDQLWTVKYKPKSYSDIIGNKTILDKLSKWLREWYVGGCNTEIGIKIV